MGLIKTLRETEDFEKKGKLYSMGCPDAFGEGFTYDRDMNDKVFIDACENPLVIAAREQTGSIQYRLRETVDKQKRWQILPRKLDMTYNKVVEQLGDLGLLKTKDYYTGQFKNCIASGLAKGAAIGVGIGAVLAIPGAVQWAQDTDMPFWFSYLGSTAVAGGFLGSVCGIGGAIGAGLRDDVRHKDAKFLDQRIEKIYRTEKPEEPKPKHRGVGIEG